MPTGVMNRADLTPSETVRRLVKIIFVIKAMMRILA